jgi:hypothetical protein
MGVARLADLPAEWSRQHQMLALLRSSGMFETSLWRGRDPPHRDGDCARHALL